jgi:5-formyltetrahydrofolate cyclo-ligase|tara:strand:+ start:85 stop:651 length:567 start_codon:yes stop_codon:yes gene_type:complete
MSNKSKLRKKYIQIRNDISKEQLLESEKNLLSIVEKNLELKKYKNIACYSSIGKEMRTEGLLDLLLEIGSDVYLPKMSEGSKVLRFLKYGGSKSTEENSLGIAEPIGSEEINPKNLDLILLPCVCFDLAGHRIGMGQGYYDHSLEFSLTSRPQLILLAHEFQKVTNCFPEKHDVAVDACLTNKQFYKF